MTFLMMFQRHVFVFQFYLIFFISIWSYQWSNSILIYRWNKVSCQQCDYVINYQQIYNEFYMHYNNKKCDRLCKKITTIRLKFFLFYWLQRIVF